VVVEDRRAERAAWRLLRRTNSPSAPPPPCAPDSSSSLDDEEDVSDDAGSNSCGGLGVVGTATSDRAVAAVDGRLLWGEAEMMEVRAARTRDAAAEAAAVGVCVIAALVLAAGGGRAEVEAEEDSARVEEAPSRALESAGQTRGREENGVSLIEEDSGISEETTLSRPSRHTAMRALRELGLDHRSSGCGGWLSSWILACRQREKPSPPTIQHPYPVHCTNRRVVISSRPVLCRL
jgi:hypothetical protein